MAQAGAAAPLANYNNCPQTLFPLMTHTLALGPITHKRAREGWRSAFSTSSLIRPCRCLSAKPSCHMQSVCTAFEAICQRALRHLFTALCPEPVSKKARNPKEDVLSGCMSDLYLNTYIFLTMRKVWKRRGLLLTTESPTRAIKKRVIARTQLSFSLSYWFWIIFWQSVFHACGGGDGEVKDVMNKGCQTR